MALLRYSARAAPAATSVTDGRADGIATTQKNDRRFAAIVYFSMPFATFWAPIVVMMGSRRPFVRLHAKFALAIQLVAIALWAPTLVLIFGVRSIGKTIRLEYAALAILGTFTITSWLRSLFAIMGRPPPIPR